MSKLILITGISKGLGYAMTEGFIQQGHTVIGCARSSDVIDKIRQKFSATNDFTSVDVANEHWVLKAVPFILNLKPKDNRIPLTIS
ncbi:SDR family NAD(P)-dependent oxidoreductase [Nostoc sp. UCD121]|uniref:SDR family NAD(P)-dependent oxidoreductase n=1 Tax=unclassified Nostoc TaxID=2593658 RepID=UPI0016248D39|nr:MULTISPECIES: SDR family NAD(P)-dependent oxidoreductase [unclassified Nostoc]MBC1224487.1 SDR family NAD(P)-dependent oxidoreductase [Nostoc sp. UCD120]MBC1280296.1 SDR family NAD(P)-dependent oxidoreductase [Nostoc sp. UCD121]MBC1299887.1 SDR family NAD(P)-dependent oxidoreductase [Nostoc sp. UCD122]